MAYDDAVDVLCKHNQQFQNSASVSCIAAVNIFSLITYIFIIIVYYFILLYGDYTDNIAENFSICSLIQMN